MTIPENPIIHIRIRELRRDRSLTQEELAEELGLSRQSINAMEAGRCLPSLPVVLQIANYFSVPVAFLLAAGLEQAVNDAEKEREENIPADEHRPNNNLDYQHNFKRKENDTMTTLVPWSPLREMRSMLDDLMDETNLSPSLAPISIPAVNISQTANEVKVEMRLPGFKKEDLSIEIGEDFVTISGETQKEKKEDAKKDDDRLYFRREFMHQSFSRTVALPAQVDGSKAEAEVKHGILHISIPKVVEEKPKTNKIEIK